MWNNSGSWPSGPERDCSARACLTNESTVEASNDLRSWSSIDIADPPVHPITIIRPGHHVDIDPGVGCRDARPAVTLDQCRARPAKPTPYSRVDQQPVDTRGQRGGVSWGDPEHTSILGRRAVS